MDVRRATAAIVLLGCAVAVVPFFSPAFAHTTAWPGLPAVYLLSGVLVGGRRLLSESDDVSFRYAGLVAVAATLATVALQVWDVRAARPGLTLPEITFVLWQPPVLVPFAAAVSLPVGVANRGVERRVAVVVLLVPFLVATVRGLLRGFGFGPSFTVLYFGLVLLAGVVAGLPLYLYGRGVR